LKKIIKMQAAQSKIYTVEDYFELEKKSLVRHEFVNGQLFEMPGESKIANDIALNVVELIRKPLKQLGYRTNAHDVKTMVKDRKIYRYPDVVVAPLSDNSDTYYIKQAILLFEVASTDSSYTDRETKLQEYTGIDSVKYYVIIDQTKMFIEVYTRNGGDGTRWYYDRLSSPMQSIDLPLFNIKLSLKDIYEDVTFTL
jgi:Uma2 family endonuclease